MANWEGRTASNGPRYDQAREFELIQVVDGFYTLSSDRDEMVTVDHGQLFIWGYDSFDPHPYLTDEEVAALSPEERGDWYDADGDRHIAFDQGAEDEFLAAIAPFLLEPLVIQTVGGEKCRYPLTAYEIKLTPEGVVEHNSFTF